MVYGQKVSVDELREKMEAIEVRTLPRVLLSLGVEQERFVPLRVFLSCCVIVAKNLENTKFEF